MAVIIEMPKLSDTMTVGTVVKWHKQVGDQVANGDVLAEVETDKATMELENFDDGYLLIIFVQEGEEVPIGSALAAVGEEGEDVEDASPAETAQVDQLETAETDEEQPIQLEQEQPVEKTGESEHRCRRTDSRISPCQENGLGEEPRPHKDKGLGTWWKNHQKGRFGSSGRARPGERIPCPTPAGWKPGCLYRGFGSSHPHPSSIIGSTEGADDPCFEDALHHSSAPLGVEKHNPPLLPSEGN